MALFPPEFIAGLLLAFLQIRLRAYFSLATYLVNGLSFFLPPEDELIDKLNGKTVQKGKSSSAKAQSVLHPLSPEEKMQNFYVKVAKTEPGVFSQTLFFELYEMLVVLVSSTVAACFCGDIFTYIKLWMFGNDVNNTTDVSYRTEISVYGLFSALLVSLWFPLQIKFAQGLATYEARLGLAIGFLGFVVAYFAIFAPKQLLDLDLEASMATLGARLEIVLRTLGFVDEDMVNVAPLGQIGTMALFATLALIAAIFASTSFLPAFRFARMYTEMTRDSKTTMYSKILLHFNMLSPLLISVLWIKPLTLDVLVPSTLVKCSPRALVRDCFASDADELAFQSSYFALKESQFHTLRLYVVLFSLLVRLLCFRKHLQYFLIEPKDSIVQIVRRPGVVDGALLQSKVRIQFNYVPIIAVQYLAPVGVILASALLLARQTSTSLWIWDSVSFLLTRVGGVKLPSSLFSNFTSNTDVFPDTTPPNLGGFKLGEDLTSETMKQFVKGMSEFNVVTADFHASFFGFFIWFFSFTWFIVSAAGLIYWKNVGHPLLTNTEQDLLEATKRNKETPKLLKNQLKSLKLKKR